MAQSELARAKVNLTLHVTGQRSDGYHFLDSLVVFPEFGDLVEAEAAETMSLSIFGPFAAALPSDDQNLVLRAAQTMRPNGRGAAIRLRKNLPVSAGLGGGSVDAAATLRLLSRLWNSSPPNIDRQCSIGADVPVSVLSASSRMRGVGEILSPIQLPSFWIVLVNPSIPVNTGSVFQALQCSSNAGMAMHEAARFDTASDLFQFVESQRNDLQSIAEALVPSIAQVLSAISRQKNVRSPRISGSGGTCFGLFEFERDAIAAADALREDKPEWWVAAAPVEGT